MLHANQAKDSVPVESYSLMYIHVAFSTMAFFTETTALCLLSLRFQPWLFSRRLDSEVTREMSLLSDSSSLCKKAMVENAR